MHCNLQWNFSAICGGNTPRLTVKIYHSQIFEEIRSKTPIRLQGGGSDCVDTQVTWRPAFSRYSQFLYLEKSRRRRAEAIEQVQSGSGSGHLSYHSNVRGDLVGMNVGSNGGARDPKIGCC